uniref:Uncharacterized protein n=1 Tax=Ditylenchus dipsaci TaxID=166011 RepID=A0A915EIP2_9BILA
MSSSRRPSSQLPVCSNSNHLPISTSFSPLLPINNSPRKGSIQPRKGSIQQRNIYGVLPTNFGSTDLVDELLPTHRKASTVSFAPKARVSIDNNCNWVVPLGEAQDYVDGSVDWGVLNAGAHKLSSVSAHKNSFADIRSNSFGQLQLAKKLSSTNYIRSLRSLAPYRPLKPLTPPQPFRPIPLEENLVKTGNNYYSQLLRKVSKKSIHFLANPYNYCVKPKRMALITAAEGVSSMPMDPLYLFTNSSRGTAPWELGMGNN